MNNKFDIYCVTGFSFSEPRFLRIRKVDPVVENIYVQDVVNQNSFLGISLPPMEVLWFVKLLKGMGIDAYAIPEEYKLSGISSEKAKQKAQNFILKRRNKMPDYDFADVVEVNVSGWVSKIAYIYFSKSEKMADEAITPPGVSIQIDRVTGKILNERDLLQFELSRLLTDPLATGTI